MLNGVFWISFLCIYSFYFQSSSPAVHGSRDDTKCRYEKQCSLSSPAVQSKFSCCSWSFRFFTIFSLCVKLFISRALLGWIFYYAFLFWATISSKHGHGGLIRVTFNFPLSELISCFDIVSLWIYTFAFPCWGQQLSLSFQLCVFLFVPFFCMLFKFSFSLDFEGKRDTLLYCLFWLWELLPLFFSFFFFKKRTIQWRDI